MKIDNLMKLFDNYFVMGESFPKFHPYVCAAILASQEKKLMPLDFMEIVNFSLKVVPAMFHQDKDVVAPLLQNAENLMKEDTLKLTENKEETKKEDSLTNAVIVGGIVVALFATALTTAIKWKK